MAAIVYQTNKKTGTTYAYESVSYWDKQKQQSRAKRKCLGRVDPSTREIIPTRKRIATEIGGSKKRGPAVFTSAARKFFGATHLLDCIGKTTGLTDDLKACFPDRYKQLMSLAYYLILEDKSPLSRFAHWAALHHHPHDEVIPSQRSSELFTSSAKRSGSDFSVDWEGAELRRSTWPTTARQFPATPDACGRFVTGITRNTSLFPRST